MANDLSELRDRIHRKSHEYFVFELGRREPTKWRMFYGATDALLDAGAAAASYSKAIAADAGANLLVCYGFLQALYVQQDAVLTLSRAVGLRWHPNMDNRLKEIREVRNRLTGHPAKAGEKDKPPRLSSAIITYGDITQGGFRGHVYFDDGMEDMMIDATLFLNDNERQLTTQMREIETRMDEEERQFRTEHAAHPLSSAFGVNFEYLLQRLHCNLSDEGRLVQAQTHAEMIREIMRTIQRQLTNGGFSSPVTSHHLGLVMRGLDLLERIMCRDTPSLDDQNEFDLIFYGLEKNAIELRTLIAEIDAKLRTRV